MNRHIFFRELVWNSLAMCAVQGALHAKTLVLEKSYMNYKIKPLTGSWLEIPHSADEGRYWNNTLKKNTIDQWRRKFFGIYEIGM